MHTNDLIVLAISLVLEVWLAVLLYKRQIWHRFPLFFTYIILAALSTAARMVTSFRYVAYFYVYWSTVALLVLFSLAALHKVFRWMFEGFYRLWWFRLFYYGTIVAALAVAIRNAFVSPPVHAHPVISLILDISIAVNFVRMGIVALFAALQKVLAVEFRRFANGIVTGFGVSSAGSLLGYLARSGFGTKLESFAKYSSGVGYILGVTIWIAAFYRPEPDEKEWSPPMSPEQMLEEVQGYMRGLGIGRTKR